MDLKEKILGDNEITSRSLYFERAKIAMDELSKIVAIAFSKWVLSHATQEYPDRYSLSFTAKVKIDKYSYNMEELFYLFTQSKEYKELMDQK